MHLTASPCYTTDTNKHDYTTNRYHKYKICINKILINAISQSSNKCAETSEINFFHRQHVYNNQETDRHTEKSWSARIFIAVIYNILGQREKVAVGNSEEADCTKARSSTESPRRSSAIPWLMCAENQPFFSTERNYAVNHHKVTPPPPRPHHPLAPPSPEIYFIG